MMMSRNETDGVLQEIMLNFSRLTGLEGGMALQRRYLWTDAFALCNFIELYSRTGARAHLERCLALVEQLHHVLGQHRSDDSRRGWISGLDAQEGERHPTIGGLRIGKALPERKRDEPCDAQREWDQDGQYFHYLTKWMHALNCLSRATGNSIYTLWAVELAQTAQARFTNQSPFSAQRRMYWKMSIDLTYPLVDSMGQHDPLDGFVTYNELAAAAARYADPQPLPGLQSQIADVAKICRAHMNLATDDPLGIGSLLFDSWRIAQLMAKDHLRAPGLLETTLDFARFGMEAFVQGGTLDYPGQHRLAFRELGLSIGLSAAERLREAAEANRTSFAGRRRLHGLLEDLMEYMPLRERIERFWMNSENWKAETWTDHREINMVMLATSLAPDTFLTI